MQEKVHTESTHFLFSVTILADFKSSESTQFPHSYADNIHRIVE
uniref:Uncharacterized protein n=1 Tax=Siphoviridae sp. ct2hZ16 TaxID=2826276 RepID=A0A8S5QVI9_9CAUD|nr:MAG TPA: hypothetical protein [Siphoviridae sp. ct2hZ16]